MEFTFGPLCKHIKIYSLKYKIMNNEQVSDTHYWRIYDAQGPGPHLASF